VKPASGTLNTFLISNTEFDLSDLYTITLLDGTVIRWTDRDQDLVVGGNTFLSTGPTISRSGVRQTAGIELSTLSLTLGVGDRSDAPLLNGAPLPLAAVRGVFDGATVKLDRIYFDAAGAQVDTLPWFKGTIEPAPGITATQIKLTVKGALAKLNARKMPWRVFQPPCSKALYSPACGVVKTEGTNQKTATTVAVDTAGGWVQIDIGGLAPARFLRGTVTFTNGPCFGECRSIKSSTLITGSTYRFDFYVPIGRDPRVGGVTQPGVVALFGCDKSLTACTQHANQDRFGGFPWTPKPESIR
jgi:uncharacterized phage protein (TIGR02218 family)